MARRIAITGAGGQLGGQLVEVFAALGDDVRALRREEFDITDQANLAQLAGQRPHVVVNAAAWTDVDACAHDPARAMRINGAAAGALALAVDAAGALVVQVSTNEVFAGDREEPYAEHDETRPINPYGASKLAGERAVAGAARRHLIVRTAWIYGGPSSFPAKIRAAAQRAAAARQPLRVVADEFGNPTPARALAERIADAVQLVEREGGPPILHLAGDPPASRYQWAARILGSGTRIEPISQQAYSRPSRPPQRAVLSTRLAAELGLAPIRWQDRPG